MLTGNIPGPRYATPNSSRRSRHQSFSINDADNTLNTYHEVSLQDSIKSSDVAKKTKLKLVRLETSEKEACEYLRTLCAEACQVLGSDNTAIEINDVLTGVLLLANFYKKIGNSKSKLEEQVELLKKGFLDLEKNQKLTIAHYEETIVKLKEENQKAADHQAEMNLKHDRRIKVATKENKELQETIKELNSANELLEDKIKVQSRKLMEVPRMEEQYLRSARGIVRQKEKDSNMKEIGYKKIEAEMKAFSFWKSKAKSLEEIVHKQKVEIDQLDTQARLNLSRFQALQTAVEREKARSTSRAQTSERVSPMFRAPSVESIHRRPISAPSAGRSPTATAAAKTPSGRGVGANGDAGAMVGFVTHGRPTTAPSSSNGSGGSVMGSGGGGDSAGGRGRTEGRANRSPSPSSQRGARSASRPGSARASREAREREEGGSSSNNSGGATAAAGAASSSLHKSIDEINAAEVIRLKELNERKDAHIILLTRKLSHARAYPLKAARESPKHGEKCHNRNNNSNFSSSSNNKNGILRGSQRTLGGTRRGGRGADSTVDVEEFFGELDEELEAAAELEAANMSASMRSEERELEEHRHEVALRLQQEYNDRIMRVKKSNPPHIAAIRSAGNFYQVG